tara:strand:+ start:136 stop:546 length:411 start_codon:yes stop_codon:yes gene_type:complete
MYSREYDTTDNGGWNQNSTYSYNASEHPLEIDFTFEEITSLFHESGSAGTAYHLNIQKDLGNGRTRQFYGIHLHVSNWLKMARREIDRARQGLPPTRYLAQRARNIYWVNPTLCNPVIDSSKYSASQKANQKKMVA